MKTNIRTHTHIAIHEKKKLSFDQAKQLDQINERWPSLGSLSSTFSNPTIPTHFTNSTSFVTQHELSAYSSKPLEKNEHDQEDVTSFSVLHSNNRNYPSLNCDVTVNVINYNNNKVLNFEELEDFRLVKEDVGKKNDESSNL